MKTQPRQHISNKYNTCSVVTSPVYTGSKLQGDHRVNIIKLQVMLSGALSGIAGGK